MKPRVPCEGRLPGVNVGREVEEGRKGSVEEEAKLDDRVWEWEWE